MSQNPLRTSGIILLSIRDDCCLPNVSIIVRRNLSFESSRLFVTESRFPLAFHATATRNSIFRGEHRADECYIVDRIFRKSTLNLMGRGWCGIIQRRKFAETVTRCDYNGTSFCFSVNVISFGERNERGKMFWGELIPGDRIIRGISDILLRLLYIGRKNY